MVSSLVSRAHAGDKNDWIEATEIREFSFPRDHGAHPDYRVEWWYYTGNLRSESGREFGYQLTFFRAGVKKVPESNSRWAVRDLHLSHFAISDIDAEQFESAERIRRRGVGWAGYSMNDGQFRVWNGDWEARVEGRTHSLVATDKNIHIELSLEAIKPAVLHGDRGLSRKGAGRGNASYYYSLSRMRTRGTIRVHGQRFDVSGQSWMDHEFGTTFLEKSQVGWDWFSIQLDDGGELMLFQLRGADGKPSQVSGTWIGADDTVIPLGPDDIRLEAGRTWKSRKSGAEYPVAWKIAIPSRGVTFDVDAALDQQELMTPRSTGVSYWEGSIRIRGMLGEKPLSGRGYLEMTGYDGKSMGQAFRGKKRRS